MDLPTIIATILSPKTSLEQRRFAHEQLEIYKTRKDALDDCFGQFMKEVLAEKREYMLHFYLRTCHELIRTRYTNLAPDDTARIKAMSLSLVSSYLVNASPLVEGAAIDMILEILKQDVDFRGFVESIVLGLSSLSFSRLACDILTRLSETLIVEDDDTLVSTKRTKLTRMFVPFTTRIFETSLGVLQEAIQRQDARLLVSGISVCGESLRWADLAGPLMQKFLELIPPCATESTPLPICISALKALSALCHHKTSDLEATRIPLMQVYDLVRRCCVLRGPFRSDEELYAAAELIMEIIAKHHGSLNKQLIVNDLLQFTSIPNGEVLSDALAVWKQLLTTTEGKETAPIDLTIDIVRTIITSCISCPRMTDSNDGEEADEDDFRGNAIRDLVRKRPDMSCSVALSLIEVTLIPNSKWKDVWMLTESLANGLSPKQLELFSNKTVASPSFVLILEQLLDLLFRACPIPASEFEVATSMKQAPERLKVLHSTHRLFEARANYMGMALDVFASAALTPFNAARATAQQKRQAQDLRKRSAAFLLQVLRRLSAKKVDDVFLHTTVLPALIQRVSASYATLDGPERFVLLESILVAGKSLPLVEDRTRLTREVLSGPFATLASLGAQVMSSLLREGPPLSPDSLYSKTKWDSRGYFADIEALPDEAKQVALALMTLSTCSEDGYLSIEMWSQLVPLAIECLASLDALWDACSAQKESLGWALTIHPVDARCLLGGRLAETMETFIEGLDDYGAQVLGPSKMSIVAFLSLIRSCALELLKAATSKDLKFVSKQECERIVRSIKFMEHRHLAALLTSLPVQDVDSNTFQQVAHVLAERLRNPMVEPRWKCTAYPGCELGLMEDVNDGARCALELAFAKSLRASCKLEDQNIEDWKIVSLAERVVLGDEHTTRHAVATLHERCVGKIQTQTAVRIVLKACLTAYLKLSSNPDAESRHILDLGIETLSRILFGLTVKDINKSKTNSRKKAPTSELSDVFGAALTNKFLEEINTSRGEKQFKSAVVDLFDSAVESQKSLQSGLAVDNAMNQQKKAKKKNKRRGKGMGEEDDEMNEVPDFRPKMNKPSWHDAKDSRDLGTLLLFNGRGEEDFDDL